MIWSILLLQAVAGMSTPPETTSGTVLWRELRTGMSPEQVADALRKVDGVADVTVKRNRKGRLSSVAIRYGAAGFLIGDVRTELTPVFDGERLSEVNLVNRGCLSVAKQRLLLLRDSLREKYGQSARERVVDDNGVEIEQRVAFWNDDTRVRMSWRVETPNADYYPSTGGKVGGALAGLANMMAQESRDAALKACPDDAGASVTTTINYSSQAAFLRTHAAEVQAREAKAKATKDAL